MQLLRHILMSFLAVVAICSSAFGASSPAYVSERITARLITAENGVAPNAQVISAALEVKLADGWKTYWKSPGAVGYPASVDWEGSANLKESELLWPAPKRFEAFDIENYGYEKAVTFPIKLMVTTPGETLVLSGAFNLLVCAELCVPEIFTLTLVLPSGTSIDRDAGALIAQAASTLPLSGKEAGFEITATALDLDTNRLQIALESRKTMRALSVIPNLGLDAAFGAPEIALSGGGKAATVSFDILAAPSEPPELELIVTDGERAAAFLPDIGGTIPTPSSSTTTGVAWFFLLAFIGGIILNFMPCVLPVLTIKFASVLKSSDQSRARIRTGFVMSALGVLAFMWALALALLAIRASGGSIGWGIQFQNPYFLIAITSIITLFAANMFGLFEIALPQSWNTKLAATGTEGNLLGDFSIGALAAILATPCSAPFLGTAVTFALAGSPAQTLAIFTALGLGLALPYLLVAIWPASVQGLPKPGPWMNTVKWIMGGLLALTSLWLLSVLAGVIGQSAMIGVAACLIAVVISLALLRSTIARTGTIAGLLAIAVLLPTAFTNPAQSNAATDSHWKVFDPNAIPAAVSQGNVVFVDITADWCLSCKANKALVLDRAPVAERLGSDAVTAMQGDWTRPDETILNYLQSHGRFGIPFNIVYGPNAPEGIALPELLTSAIVMNAIAQAGG